MKQKKYFQLIPERILEALPAIEGVIKAEIKGYQRDYLLEVISILSRHIRKEENMKSPLRGEHITPLKKAYIKKLVPQGDKYLNQLVQLNIVDRFGPYVIGEKCYQYRFNETYKSRYKNKELKNVRLINRIRKVYDEIQSEAEKTVWGRSEQVSHLKQITIDPSYKNELEWTDLTLDQINYIEASVQRINNGDISYSVDPTSFRFHSNVTNMPSSLREYIRVNGHPLVDVDIKNSQPFLTTIILTEPSRFSWLTATAEFKYVLCNLEATTTKDAEKYVDLVVKGRLYEFMQAEIEKAGITLTRKETKGEVFRILFARNRMPQDETGRTARQVFRKHFPEVHKVFNKVRGSSKGTRHDQYSRFAILMQRIESWLMLKVALKRIYKEIPGVVAITIHDSAMVGISTSHVSAARQIIEATFYEYTGYKPEIRVAEKQKIKKSIVNN